MSFQMKKTFVVIPTIRNLDFLASWKKFFKNAEIIICEDHPHKSINVPKIGKKTYHYSWHEIDQDLEEKSWIIPRKVSAIRNYGFFKAYQMGAEVIVTLDDDCYPVKNHDLLKLHSENLSLSTPQKWTNTYPDARFLYTRGMPYLNRRESPVAVSHGLWTNVIDFDAPTHLQNLDFRAKFAEHFLQIIPQGAYYPMCSMNLAFTRKVTPLMYLPLMGQDIFGNDWGYDRFDDIWAGIFSKKIMDHLNYAVISGAPFVKHQKASNPFTNLQKEAKGIETNETLFKKVDQINLTSKDIIGSYRELINSLKIKEEYFLNLKTAINLWLDLFIE